jgi:cytochrome c6
MSARRKPPSRWSRPAAEAAVVMIALALAFGAAFAGFVVGRETAEDDEPTAAETSETETQATETTETETPAETETDGDTPTETEDGGDADGEAVFASAGCGGCHEFEPAGSTGTIGPPLDGIDRSKDEIAEQVRNGGGGMPAFEGRLSAAEIDAVADYVENAGG